MNVLPSSIMHMYAGRVNCSSVDSRSRSMISGQPRCLLTQVDFRKTRSYNYGKIGSRSILSGFLFEMYPRAYQKSLFIDWSKLSVSADLET